MERRILVLPKTEPFGFTKISDVRANSRITAVQMCVCNLRCANLDSRVPMDALKRSEINNYEADITTFFLISDHGNQLTLTDVAFLAEGLGDR